METRKKRILLYFIILWGKICLSLAHGEVGKWWESPKPEFWSGIVGQTCLGQNKLGFWGTYQRHSFGMKVFLDYGWWESFIHTERDDYGYQEKGVIVPEMYEGKLEFLYIWQKLFLRFSGKEKLIRWREYTKTEIDWMAEIVLKKNWWWFGVNYGAQQWQTTLGGAFWWERCEIGGFISLIKREESEIHATSFLWNGEKTLGFYVSLPLYRRHQYREVGTLGWKKYWEKWFFETEIGLSLWNAGRLQGGIGWKW